MNNNKPATKEDVRRSQDELATATANGFTSLETRMTSVESRLDHIEENMATKDDLKNFATKDDLQKLSGRVDNLGENVENLGYKIDRIDHTQQSMLEILDENTQILREIRHLPARVERLEKTVFRQ